MNTRVANPSVVVSARGEQRLRTGHPWIYRADVSDVDASGGDIVAVIGPRRRTLGHALFSDRSQIPIRMLVRGDAPFDASMLRARLERALQFRETLKETILAASRRAGDLSKD